MDGLQSRRPLERVAIIAVVLIVVMVFVEESEAIKCSSSNCISDGACLWNIWSNAIVIAVVQFLRRLHD